MHHMSALELSAAIRAKKLGVAEVVSAYFDHIERVDSHTNAFLTICKEHALARAKAVQPRIRNGEPLSPLAGVPIALSDNISTKGIRTTCASKMLSEYVPVFNATVVDKLEQAGMIVVGKLNMDEFAMGNSSETGAFGPVRNPWDASRVAGGSSGGCAAAVAAGEVPLAIGSDTGGGIRQPCAFCGVTGIKPTYGAVSRYGLVAYASSMDQIGPVGRNIDDCTALLSILSGPDERDSTCVPWKPFDFGKEVRDVAAFGKTASGATHEDKLESVRIGLPMNLFENDFDPDVKQAVLAAAKELEAAGAHVEPFEMPLTEAVIPAFTIIACAEASSNLARYDGLKYGHRSKNAETLFEVYRLSRSEGFGLEVKRRIMFGSLVLSSGYYEGYYQKALKVRSLIKNAYDGLFKRFDTILSPVAPTVAYRTGTNTDDPVKMVGGDIFTVPASLAGLPTVALPCGFSGKSTPNGEPDGMPARQQSRLPIGFQLVGDLFSEEKLIRVARVYQRRTDYHMKRRDGLS